jgi:quinolinate synthase
LRVARPGARKNVGAFGHEVHAAENDVLPAGLGGGEQLVRAGLTTEGQGVTPITYINSTAAIKAFVGEHGGVVCTSSNAAGAMKWGPEKNSKLLFLPDQHLGRNTGNALGIPLSEMVVWDPCLINGGLTPDRLRAAKIIL